MLTTHKALKMQDFTSNFLIFSGGGGRAPITLAMRTTLRCAPGLVRDKKD